MKRIQNNSIGRDTVKLSSSKIITMLVSMISTMMLSRFRTLEEYGTYSQIITVVNVTTSLLMLGLPNSINYFLARAETNEEKQKFLSVYYTLSTLFSFIVGFTLVIATPIIISYFNNELIKNFIFFLAIYPWAKIISTSIDNVLITCKKASMLMLFKLLNSVSLIFIILLVQFCNWDFRKYMILFIFVEGVFAASVYIIVNKMLNKLKISFNFPIVKSILVFSIPIGLASVVGTLNIELDKLVIGSFLNTEQLAIYANASKEIPVTIIASSLTAVLLPSLSRMLKSDKNKNAIELWNYAIKISYVIICFVVTYLFVYASDILVLLYSDKYLPGTAIFKVYSLVLLLRFTYFGMILNAKGKTKFIFYSSILSLAGNLVLNYILFYILGPIGPAIATFLSQLIINVVQLVFTSRIINVPFIKLFPWRVLANITAVNILFGFIFYYLKIIMSLELFISELCETIILGVIWGSIYMFIYRKEIRKNWIALNNGDIISV